MNQFLEMLIDSNFTENQIFTSFSPEALSLFYKKIPVQNKYLYDILIEFPEQDQIFLKKLTEQIPDSADNLTITNYIFEYYFSLILFKNLILNNVITSITIDEINNELESLLKTNYKGFQDLYLSSCIPDLRIDDEVKKICTDENKRCRISINIDSVIDITLLKVINSCFSNRLFITFFAFTKKDYLDTYYDLLGNVLNDIHDYTGFVYKLDEPLIREIKLKED
ncbi:MAG: hypothetical protein RR478_04965 [Bacilli bacterium]